MQIYELLKIFTPVDRIYYSLGFVYFNSSKMSHKVKMVGLVVVCPVTVLTWKQPELLQHLETLAHLRVMDGYIWLPSLKPLELEI